MARHGGRLEDWLDLSTGINPVPYPLPDLPVRAWTALPTGAEIAGLEAAAGHAYGTAAEVVALAGAQAAIQIVPQVAAGRRAAVLGPTYNEHAAALVTAGWQVAEAREAADLAGADLAVVVNPNNPDGRRHQPEALRRLASRVGLLVIDESFADAAPGLSLAPTLGDAPDRLVVLRSFGKFYGLAGLRLGFAIAGPATVAAIRARAGPWPVGGAAIATGIAALGDDAWRQATLARLHADTARLDAAAIHAGWRLVGGTALFRSYDTGDAAAARDRLARARIWSRIFPWSAGWIRLGLPGDASGWARLEAALSG